MRGVSDNWSPYAILGVAETCDQSEITAAYRQLSLRFHPDQTLQLGPRARAEADERMIAINQAYQAIGSASRRNTFDAERAARKAAKQQSSSAGPTTASSSRASGQGDSSARSNAYIFDEATYRRYVENGGPVQTYQRPWFVPTWRTITRIVAAFLILVFVALLWPAKELDRPTPLQTVPPSNVQPGEGESGGPISAMAQPGPCAFVQLAASSNYQTEAQGWLARPLEVEGRGFPVFVATNSELSELAANVMIVGVRTYGQSDRYAALAAASEAGISTPIVRDLRESDCKSLVSFADLRNQAK